MFVLSLFYFIADDILDRSVAHYYKVLTPLSASANGARIQMVNNAFIPLVSHGFDPCHKAGYEKTNPTQAIAGKVPASAATLQFDSQSSGAATGP
jgi:hypothetical protein